MNEKQLRKMRREFRQIADRPWREYVDTICKLPLWNKLMWCWFILRHKEVRE